MLERLDARISAWNVDSVIGDIFVDIVRHYLYTPLLKPTALTAGLGRRACHQSKSFELYTSFVNNFDRANHYARKLMNNNEGFQKFVAVCDACTLSHALAGARFNIVRPWPLRGAVPCHAAVHSNWMRRRATSSD